MSTSFLDSSPAATTENRLAAPLLDFYDDFVEFHGCCAFLCDAVVAMTSTGIEWDEASIHGLHVFSSQVKENTKALKLRLKELQEISCTHG